MRQRRIFSFFLSSLLFLSACGGKGSDLTLCANRHWDGTVGLCVPDGWQVIERKEIAERGAPDDVLLVVQAVQPVSGQYPTLVVTREALREEMTPEEYSEANIRSVRAFPGYDLLDMREIAMDGDNVKMHVFASQTDPKEPKQRFYQVSTVAKGVGYTVTVGTAFASPDTLQQEIVALLSHVHFEEQKE